MKSLFIKKFKLLIGLFIISFISLAQSPESMNYQAVMRNSSGTIIANQSVGIRIKILQGSANGSAVYNETFNPTTNAYGMVSLQIGTGSVVSGTFSSIDWGNNSYFVETAADILGGSNYSVISTTQFMSVPYALYAKSAGSSPADNDWTESGNNIFRSSGNVGIGTTNPSSKLDVNGTGSFTGDLISGGDITTGNNGKLILWRGGIQDPYIRHVSNKSIGFFTVDSEKMRIAEGGNVGISTTNPSSKLDVNGDINLTGDLKINGVAQTFGGSLGLEQITENGNTGFRLMGSDPNNFGDIGANSTDLSTQDEASSTRGATAPNAFAAGRRTTASGWHATALGSNSVASGDNSIAVIGGTASGSSSNAIGVQTIASGQFSTSIGVGATASGERSTAIGSNVTASANRSTAIGGDGTIASGDHSLAMGQGNTASGNNSVAIGDATTASGNLSTSMGNNTIASNENSTAMGINTNASGNSSTAMGNSTTASGTNSTAMGSNNTASGTSSTAMGRGTVASGSYSTSLGELSTASGSRSLAAGQHASATAANSIAIGHAAIASGYGSIALGGEGNESAGLYSTAMGRYTKAHSVGELTIGSFNTNYNPVGGASTWDNLDRLFVIGNGTSQNSRSNAFLVLKNGNTTINGQLNVNGNIFASGTITSSSDLRYKQNINSLDNALEKVLKLRGVSYNFKVEEYSNKKFPAETQIGFIAQELLEIYPQLISKDKEGYYSVDYSKISPILVEAIKEQQKKIDKLETELGLIKNYLNIKEE
tara:strand:- start:503 stop:2809 length:2307 start_codon:yes stop_codon:yes gene_type:complete